MSEANFEAIVGDLRNSDARIREEACETLQTGDDLRLVKHLIGILENDPSNDVQYDAEQALTRLCFARATEERSYESIAKWWKHWWISHSHLSNEELLSECLSRYLNHVIQGDDTALEDEITLSLAFDSGVSWPSLYNEHQRYIASALVDTLVSSDNANESMKAKIRPFARCLLERAPRWRRCRQLDQSKKEQDGELTQSEEGGKDGA